MGRSDFEARLQKLGKVPSVGAKRAVNQAMLQDKINELRNKAEEESSTDNKDGPDTVSAGLWLLLLVSFLVLGSLFAHDPEEAKRKALVMVPLMVLLLAVAAYREFRRTGWGYLVYNFTVDLDFLDKLFRMFR